LPNPSILTAAFKILTNVGEDSQPVVVASPDGRFGIYFTGTNLSGRADTDILGYTYAGSNIGSNGVGSVNAANGSSYLSFTSNERHLNLAFFDSGDRVDVYESGGEIYGRLYSKLANGNYDLYRTFLVSENIGASGQFQPEVITFEAGGFVVAWEDSINQRVYSKLYTTDGTAIVGGVNFAASTTTQTAAGADFNIDLIAAGNGGFAISYMSSSAGSARAAATFYTSSGSQIVTLRSDGSSGVNYETGIAQDNLGNIGFVFNGNNGNDAVVRIVSSNFATGTPDLVLADSRNTGETPRIIALNDGRFMVVYSGQNSGPVIGQIVNNNGTLDGTSFVIAANGFQPEITRTEDGRVVVTWREGSGVNGDVFAAMYDPRISGVSVNGTNGRDNYVGSDFDDFIAGYDGDDLIYTGGGSDGVYGGSGDDFMAGGSGDDYLSGDNGIDTIFGEAGDDVIIAAGPTISVIASGLGEVLVGGAGNDTLYGSSGSDSLLGGDENDSLVGYTGNDLLIGGAGDDTIEGDVGADYIYTGTGTNQVFGGEGADVVFSEGSADTIFGGANHNYYYRIAMGTSFVVGSTGIDEFIGGSVNSDDSFQGGGGIDYAFGGDGNDLLVGQAGGDVLIGQNGNDTLEGGAGVNLLWANDVGNDQIRVVVSDGGTQVVEFFEAGGANDAVRLLGSTLTSFAGIQNLVTNIGVAQGANLMVNAGSGAQLYLNLGANQTAIWFQGVSAYSLTSADFLFA
jgi:hypothetical protein